MKSILLALQLMFSSFALLRAQTPRERFIPLNVRVIDGRNGAPLPDVEVTLSDSGLRALFGPARPDGQVNCRFQVKPGNYVLSADSRDWGTTYYGQLPEGQIKTVSISPEDSGASITFQIFPKSTISGAIHDDLGDPIKGISVSLNRAFGRTVVSGNGSASR